MIKRVFDTFAAAVGLVFLSPLFALIAILIKNDDGGAVFFRQIRVGLNGKHFDVLKFRSMRTAKHGSDITVGGDDRISRVGYWLRRYKLDELPQLFNVLVGEMSLVGPRPEVPRLMSKYTTDQRKTILSVKPGITDFAAIELRHEEQILANHSDPEEAYVSILMPQKYHFYAKYVKEQSFWLDIKLILLTLAVIFKRDNSSVDEKNRGR